MSEPLYKRSNGQEIPVREMNDYHLLSAIRLMKRKGYLSANDVSLFASDPENQCPMILGSDELLTAMEAEANGRGLVI